MTLDWSEKSLGLINVNLIWNCWFKQKGEKRYNDNRLNYIFIAINGNLIKCVIMSYNPGFYAFICGI